MSVTMSNETTVPSKTTTLKVDERTLYDLFQDEIEEISLSLQALDGKTKFITDLKKYPGEMCNDVNNKDKGVGNGLLFINDTLTELKQLLPEDKVSISCRSEGVILKETIDYIKFLQTECEGSTKLDEQIKCLDIQMKNLVTRLERLRRMTLENNA